MKRLIAKKIFLTVFALLALGLFAASSEAALTYQFTGTIWGDVDTVEFNNANLLINITGDPSLVQSDGAGGYYLSGLTGSISISGGDLGTTLSNPLSGSFTTPTAPLYVFADGTGWVGFGTGIPDPVNLGANDLLDLFIPALALYDLKYATGPFSVGADGTTAFNLLAAGTTFGGLTVDQFDSATFQAVPIPAPVLLLATGLIGLVGIRKKIKQ